MSPARIFHVVRFEQPDYPALKDRGLTAIDMHFHTNHSDSPTRVRDALKLAKFKGIGLSITDHNQVSGVIEAHRWDPSVLVIPGIEISAWDGPHILVYFYQVSEMVEFYETHVYGKKSKSPYLATRLTTQEIVERTSDYPCVTVAAHPFGYLLFNKGVARCIERDYLSHDTLHTFDGVEVISGGMARSLNKKAVRLALGHHMGITGGTDGHLLRDLGNVVTCAYADDVEGFLDAILKKENCVVGTEKSAVEKGIMASAMLPKYFRYTLPSLQIHYLQNIPRVQRFLKRAKPRKGKISRK
jgi:predicted metal-dependent phosphoesterase TrpH